MAISKNSIRVQFTLNTDKPKEKEIKEFLDRCFNPNSTIKEIIYNYIVSNCGTKLPQVAQSEVPQNYSKSLEVSDSELLDNNIVAQSKEKLVEVSDEIEVNELEELKKFI